MTWCGVLTLSVAFRSVASVASSHIVDFAELRALAEGSYEHTVSRVSQAALAAGSHRWFGEAVEFSVLATWPTRVRLLSADGVCVETTVRQRADGAILLGDPVPVELQVHESHDDHRQILAERRIARWLGHHTDDGDAPR